MSYTPMLNNTIPRGSYVPPPPEYDNNAYKIPTQSYNPYPPPTGQQLYMPTNSSSNSIALFHIPTDGTNSLYIDGVPNDTTEREVSRTTLL